MIYEDIYEDFVMISICEILLIFFFLSICDFKAKFSDYVYLALFIEQNKSVI